MNILIEDWQKKFIEKIAKRDGVSQAEVVRAIFDKFAKSFKVKK